MTRQKNKEIIVSLQIENKELKEQVKVKVRGVYLIVLLLSNYDLLIILQYRTNKTKASKQLVTL